MTVAAPWVRAVYELGKPRRIVREDVAQVVKLALSTQIGETILNSGMEFKVDGAATEFPLETVGKRLEVAFRVVVVRGADSPH